VSAEHAGQQHYNLTLLVLAASALAYALSQTMVAPALLEIQKELHTSTTSVTSGSASRSLPWRT
jgi:predicted MFS family arabinose efflux permease